MVQFEVLVVVALCLDNIVLLAVATITDVVARARVESGCRRPIQLDHWLFRGAHVFFEPDQVLNQIHVFCQNGQLLSIVRKSDCVPLSWDLHL